ncbi:hypothetical protein APHAL10511_005603 [Amanita phalloides]|nr:hypothetical protein APHAL10511_005603 [Amanita phalloides]
MNQPASSTDAHHALDPPTHLIYFPLYPTVLPRFSRSLSMPSPELPRTLHPSPDHSHQLSLELADSLQCMIHTILHVSPQQLLDPAKEQFAACTLSIPTPCMSAMLTVIKNLNYISANMTALCGPETSTSNISHAELVDFDIGELLQNVGDGLSGYAAQVGVDLVLYHSDAGLKHIWVRGDEDGINYSLSHTIRQILSTAQRGDTLEIGLSTTPSSSADVVHVSITISHKFSATDQAEEQTRTKPLLSTLVLRRVLSQIGAKLVSDLPLPPCIKSGRTCQLRLTVARGKSSPPAPAKPETDSDLVAAEPSLEQLSTFAESLKGQSVALYASSKGCFARHFTSYLTTWGMDVNHASPQGNIDGAATLASDVPESSQPQEAAETFTSNGDAPDQAPESSTRFIVIDDDVDILKERLYSLRNDESPHNTRRSSLANILRPQSSPPARTGPLPLAIPLVLVLHFTSLANYKAAKDALQTVLASYTKLNIPAPEVMIIPKPAGPRRLLTALYMAVTKPVIDPLFLPIATSPQSPGIFAHGTFFGSYESANTFAGHRLSKSAITRLNGGKNNIDRSPRSSMSSDHLSLHPPSPLGASDGVEYFSQTAYRLGGSPSSGLVIQSPDGQPAGIFFHPRNRSSSRTFSTPTMERDKGQQHDRKQPTGRATANLNNRTVLTPQLQPAPPAPTARASSTTGVPPVTHVKPVVRSQSGPGPEQASTSTSTLTNEISSPSSVAPVKADPQVIAQAVSSPDPTPAQATPRRLLPRRRPAELDSSANAGTSSPTSKSNSKKKAKAPENLIVPPISVLIVDDNPINQTILTTFMKKNKIQYDIASNGLEAVEKWKTSVFHLILMDIQMPVMDGIEATKEIRRMEKSTAQALYPTTPTSSAESGLSPARTPSDLLSPESRNLTSPYHPSVIIVALTASSLQSDRVAALGAGCNDFLTKPVSLIWLNSKIIEWGSIKALQMWADLRPNVMKSISYGQQAQARSIAERLHVPKNRRNATHAQAADTGPTAAQAGKASSNARDDQTPNATGRTRDETRPGKINNTSRSDESQAGSNKAGVKKGNAAGDDEDSETPKATLQPTSSFPTKSITPRESLDTVHRSDASQNSLSTNGCTVETTNHPPDVS